MLKSTEITAQVVIFIITLVALIIIIVQIYIVPTLDTSKSNRMSVLPV